MPKAILGLIFPQPSNKHGCSIFFDFVCRTQSSIFCTTNSMRLNLPAITPRIKTEGENQYIFDSIRKKYLLLTPEEWVRQHFISYLINSLGFSAQLLALEKEIKLNGSQKRCDIVAYNRYGQPVLIVECKAPQVKISQKTFDQIARYNLVLGVEWLIVTNGLEHYCCQVQASGSSYQFIEKLPDGSIQDTKS